MKKFLFATTALFALGGVTAAVADVTVSGHVRFHYDSWKDNVKDEQASGDEANDSGRNNNAMSTDPEVWIKGNMVTENGLTVAPEIRFKGKDGKTARHYIRLSDDWGTLTLGRQHSPARLMSLDGEWRGTVSGANAPVGPVTTHMDRDDAEGADPAKDLKLMTTPDVGKYAGVARVIYQTPNISGFQFGISSGDAGGSSKANPTDFALVYSMDAFDGGSVKFGYASSITTAKNAAAKSTKNTDSQFGVELSAGSFGGSLVQTAKKAKPNMGSESKQTGQELEVSFNASDNVKVVLHMFNAKGDSGSLSGEKYKSTGVGAKYTIAPGLWTSLGYNTFSTTPATGAKQKGNGLRIRVHAGF